MNPQMMWEDYASNSGGAPGPCEIVGALIFFGWVGWCILQGIKEKREDDRSQAEYRRRVEENHAKYKTPED